MHNALFDNDTKNPFNLAFCDPVNYEVVLSISITVKPF